MTTTISFPGLGIDRFTISRTAISFGKFSVAWYGLIIVIGMIVAVSYVMWRAKQNGISTDSILDLAIAVIVSGVIGARLYYVLTSLDHYDSFFDVFKIWEGGLGIYGGIIAGTLAVLVTARVKKMNFLMLADMVMPAVLIAQSIGRWGNFINGEAYGSETALPWRMGLHGDYFSIYVHPTFLYESLWTCAGFILANLLYRRRRYHGQVLLFGFAWYGFGRMFIELLRTDSLYICSYHAWFTKISVIVGFIAFAVSAFFLIYFAVKGRRDEIAPPKTKEKTL
ncbi:MAG: prolipoprotein diacylglyceryl transferase [Clostridia bacterium]|nr:prolipoprotein diacylglyceryl transferase [Clostridia bacterium]MBR6795523.1 prolipoprotein diacylglyceryl transferase [Clostridia bacterium]